MVTAFRTVSQIMKAKMSGVRCTLRPAVIAACLLYVLDRTACAATTIPVDNHSAGVAITAQPMRQQPQQYDKLFLQICSQQQMSPERIIQGVAAALHLPIRHITVLDVTEVDSVASALKLAQRRSYAKQNRLHGLWNWTLPNSRWQAPEAVSHASDHAVVQRSLRRMLQPANNPELRAPRVPWQAVELCLRTLDAQALQVRLARAAGNGSLVAGLEAASAFVPGQSGGPTGVMITLRARSMDDLAAFALGQNERQGSSGEYAAFLVNSFQMQPDAGSIRIFLVGAFVASIGVGLVVYSILGVCFRPEQDSGTQFIAAGHKCQSQAARSPQPVYDSCTASRTFIMTKWQACPRRSGALVVKPRRKLVRLLRAKSRRQ